jgi:hypothetical protein
VDDRSAVEIVHLKDVADGAVDERRAMRAERQTANRAAAPRGERAPVGDHRLAGRRARTRCGAADPVKHVERGAGALGLAYRTREETGKAAR